MAAPPFYIKNVCTTHTHTQFAFVYIFNLVVGVGALALPRAFSEAGLILGALLLFVLAFVSYVAATYMVEAMATANAYALYQSKVKSSRPSPGSPNIQRDVSIIRSTGP